MSSISLTHGRTFSPSLATDGTTTRLVEAAHRTAPMKRARRFVTGQGSALSAPVGGYRPPLPGRCAPVPVRCSPVRGGCAPARIHRPSLPGRRSSLPGRRSSLPGCQAPVLCQRNPACLPDPAAPAVIPSLSRNLSPTPRRRPPARVPRPPRWPQTVLGKAHPSQ